MPNPLLDLIDDDDVAEVQTSGGFDFSDIVEEQKEDEFDFSDIIEKQPQSQDIPLVTEDLKPVQPDPYQFQKDSPFVSQDPQQLLSATAPLAPSEYLIDDKPVSRDEFKSRMYDDDMVEKMQSGNVKLTFPQDEEMQALIERQSQAGSRTQDKWDYLMSGIATVGAGVMGMQNFLTDIVREGLAPLGVDVPKSFQEYQSEENSKLLLKKAEEQIEKTRAYEEEFFATIEQGDYLNAADQALNMVVQSAPLSVMAAVTGGAGGAAASLGTLGAVSASSEYAGSDKDEYKGLTQAEKLGRAAAIGTFEAVGEVVTGGIISKNFKLLKTGLKNTVKKAAEVGGEEAAQAVAIELGKKVPIQMFKEFGVDILKEWGSEGVTELGQMMTDDLMGIKDYSAGDYLYNGLQSAALGAVGGSVMGLPTAGMGIKRYADEKLKKGDGETLKAKVDERVKNQTYTEQEGEKIKVAIDNRTEAVNSVPEELVKNTEVVDLVNQKQDLEKQTIDPVLAPIQASKIKAIDEQINEKVAPILEAQAEMDEIMKEVEAEKKKKGEEKAMKNKLKLYDKLLGDENLDATERRVIKGKKKIVEEKLESYQEKKKEEKEKKSEVDEENQLREELGIAEPEDVESALQEVAKNTPEKFTEPVTNEEAELQLQYEQAVERGEISFADDAGLDTDSGGEGGSGPQAQGARSGSEELKSRVDQATESTISFLKDNKIISSDPTIQKSGFVDLETAIRAVGELIKKGIDLHGDIKRAVDEAIAKFKGTTFYKSLKPEAQEVIEQKIREEHEPKVEPITKPSEGEGVKALATRVVEGDAPKDVQDAIEKHGLNYSIESHPDAEAKAAAFIAEVGVEKALKAARTGKIDGGAQTFVWIMAVDAVQKERIAETNTAKKQKLLKKETDLINEFDERVRSQGRGISALQSAYQVSDFGYRLGAILNRAQEAAGESGVSDILKRRLEELSAQFDEISRKHAEAEKKLKESPPTPIIKEPAGTKQRRASLSPEESTRKQELSKKYRGVLNDVTRILSLLAESDFREYAALVFKEAAGDFKTFAREMINNVGAEIREHLPKLYKDLGGKENPEMQSIQSKLKREIEEYHRRKREGDFTKKEPKEKPTLDEETFNLLVEKNRLKEEIDTEIEKERLKNRPMGKKIEESFVDAVSLPKSLMASADMSAPLRQGAILSFRHPIMAAQAARDMFRQAFSESAHRDWLTRLRSTPEYYTIKKAELYLAEPNARLNAKEEQFISNIAEKIPIWGRIVKGSQRAYTGYLNSLRVSTFAAFHDALIREGVKGKELDAELKSYAEFINNASGRGTLGKFEESAPLLNAAFFSPRYVVSRFNLINPIRYTKMEPRTRIEALKTMGAYLGVGLMTMALAQAGGADVEDDPRSADFGKIKVGNTRFDMWAGMSQVAVLLSRLATGETKSISGQTRQLGEGYKATTRGDILLRFGRSKLSPSAGVATDFLVGKDFNGNEVTVKDEVMKSILPLWASDIRKIYDEAGAGQAAAGGVASFFGVGVQNYNPDNKNKATSTGAPQPIPSPLPK